MVHPIINPRVSSTPARLVLHLLLAGGDPTVGDHISRETSNQESLFSWYLTLHVKSVLSFTPRAFFDSTYDWKLSRRPAELVTRTFPESRDGNSALAGDVRRSFTKSLQYTQAVPSVLATLLYSSALMLMKKDAAREKRMTVPKQPKQPAAAKAFARSFASPLFWTLPGANFGMPIAVLHLGHRTVFPAYWSWAFICLPQPPQAIGIAIWLFPSLTFRPNSPQSVPQIKKAARVEAVTSPRAHERQVRTPMLAVCLRPQPWMAWDAMNDCQTPSSPAPPERLELGVFLCALSFFLRRFCDVEINSPAPQRHCDRSPY